MARSVTSRNLLGGFLGGFIGLTSFGLIHAAAMPFGVLIGVLVGWWYEAIVCTIVEDCQRTMVRARRVHQFVCDRMTMLRRAFESLGPDLVLVARFFIRLGIICLWLIGRPVAFVRWCCKHPMNRAYVVRALATTIFVGLLLGMAVLSIPDIGNYKMVQRVPGQPDMIDLSLLVRACWAMLFALPAINWTFDTRGSQRLRERYGQQNTIAFFGRELLDCCKAALATWGFMAFAALYFVGGWVLIIIGVLAPVSVAVGFVRGIYQVATRSSHWLCLGVTMTVTTLAAWRLSPHLGNPMVLWSTALGTGIISALATEGIRRIFAWYFAENEFGRRIASIEFEQFLGARIVAPIWQHMFRMWRRLDLERMIAQAIN